MNIHVLAVGDVVGDAGVDFLCRHLPTLRKNEVRVSISVLFTKEQGVSETILLSPISFISSLSIPAAVMTNFSPFASITALSSTKALFS